MDAAAYRAQVIAEHEAAVVAARAKVDRIKSHLVGAIKGAEQAEAALAAAVKADHEFVEPTEHTTVRA